MSRKSTEKNSWRLPGDRSQCHKDENELDFWRWNDCDGMWKSFKTFALSLVSIVYNSHLYFSGRTLLPGFCVEAGVRELCPGQPGRNRS